MNLTCWQKWQPGGSTCAFAVPLNAPSYDCPRSAGIGDEEAPALFPVLATSTAGEQSAGELMPFFIGVRNGGGKEKPLATEGNEHVIRARFADADYFVREDLKRPLEEYLPRLKTLTFQVKLGSMLDKSRRIGALVEDLASMLGLDRRSEAARRAAELARQIWRHRWWLG
jgi:hypothetical protein